MKISLLTEQSVDDLTVVASLQNPRSLASLLASYADEHVYPDEDFEAEISKHLLPDSYKANPSFLGKSILSKCSNFLDSAGFQTPLSSTVTVKLLRNEKPANARYTHARPSIKRIIKEFLDLNHPKWKHLNISLSSIPPFLTSHPEQLTYQVKNETGIPIRIKRNNNHWIITRR